MEVEMRRLVLTMVSVTALIGFAVPASAHDYNWASPHDQEHEGLDRQHEAIHDELDAEHAAAHEEGLTPWEHEQLHRELEYRHEQADAQIRWEHERWHRRGSWQWYSRYRPSYGYYGYYGW